MKNSSIFLMACMTVVLSCSHEIPDGYYVSGLQTIYASLENDRVTKSSIGNESLDVTWSAGDAINVFFGSSESSRFVTAEAGKIAQFKGSIGVVTGGGEGLDDETSLWGVYPYDSENVCDGNTVTLRLPFIQQSAENTFANGLFPVVARSRNFYMSFYNLCGGLRFSVSSSDIRSVTISGNNGENIAGKVKVSMPLGGVPVVSEIISGERELVMNAPDGECFKPGILYYFIMFPTEFTKGITVTYHKKDSYASYVINRALTLKRSVFNKLPDRDAGLTFIPETLDGWGPGETIGGDI